MDDADCIAGLRLQGKPEPLKRSLVYTYRFPIQEYKIKEKDSVVNVTEMLSAGTVISLDDQKCILRIKYGVENLPLPEYMHIGPSGPLNTKVLRGALYRFADSMLANPQKITVGREIMRRSLPRIAGKTPGTPVIVGADILAETIEAVAGLQDSYLFIQGPPGTGKTYASSHIIVELIARGHKVGVSSN